MPTYEFKLGDDVKLVMTGEKGQIRGRAAYIDTMNHYLVRYVRADGCQVEDWFSESALTAARS